MTYKKYTYNKNKDIVYSVVTPVFNQEHIIVKNLQSIINHTVGNFEIILILDFCYDKTEINLFSFLDHFQNNTSNLVQITVFKNNEKPLFETKCDNIGFKYSSGKYCLEIQADMEMTQIGYNLELTKPFLLLDNVIAVSGRCATNLFNDSEGIGKLGYDIMKTVNQLNIKKNCFYVYETCNRGPLLLDRQKLIEMNYLDEEEYFLDNSDHDLMARAFLEKNYICGYVPIDFKSPLGDGSTRKNNFIDCQEYYINLEEKKKLTHWCKNKLGINKYKTVWKNRKNTVYNIENID